MSLNNTSSYYPYIEKGSSLEGFKTVSTSSFNTSIYTDVLSGSYPFTSSINVEYMSSNLSYTRSRRHIYALKNTLNNYKYYSSHYSFSSSLGDKFSQELCLINIPAIFCGSSIDRGTVELSFYVSGSLIGKIQDINKNGELIQTVGSNGSGSVAGVVLYNEGFIVLTGSWNLNNSFTETYIYSPITIDNPKWIYWGAGINQPNNITVSSSYDLNFESVNYISTLTMLAHADKNEYNYSNNPTYIVYEDEVKYKPTVTDDSYIEFSEKRIKNTTKYAYDNFTGSLEKQTFISKIGIYDENKNLIAIAKVSKPIKKTENRDLTFKLKLDI